MTRPIFAEPQIVHSLADCYFYHSMDIPGYGEVRGEWDLRARTLDYLGHVDFAGKRVLEIGPASGYLTFYMERQGAEVVCVDVDDSQPWDFVPQAGALDERVIEERRQHIGRMKSGFWLAHRALGSRARVHYGDPARLPKEIGRFDIAVMANVLLHCREGMSRPLLNLAGRALPVDDAMRRAGPSQVLF
ncbi:MAG: class I SAM-dependent methyltransferase [Alphaproteobacteria bacterium]|nr:class I SAM-dependent methyltransferase [Alphaproteobacteria bacterium]